jgi:starch synthase
MPKWGNINERRNQLHEVIRLSGMNIIIDDTDHPLIIKVASIQAARMQVYFIDNEEYFNKRLMMTDENGTEYEDNAERAIFYARGVLETLKKLRWCPDVIHCHGWMSAIAPLYIKTAYRDEPSFADAKVLFSAYDEMPQITPPSNLVDCLNFRHATPEILAETGIDFSNPQALGQLAIAFSDGFVQGGSAGAHPEMLAYAKEKGIPTWEMTGIDNLNENYGACYDSIVESAAE